MTILTSPQYLVPSTTVIFLTSGSSWTVPADWNSACNTIEVIGGGAGGGGVLRLETKAAVAEVADTLKKQIYR